jgi:MFS family permease
VIIEAKVPHPMLDLSLFLRRPFSVATASSVMNYTCVYSIVFLMPFYLIQGRGYSPARAGLVLTIPSFTRAVASPLFGVLSDKVGARGPSTLGMALLSGGLVLLSRLGSDSALKDVIVALLVAGLGAGMFVSPNTSALMGSAPRHQQGIAAGVMATARNVGMAMGVGMAGALFTTVLARAPQNDAGSALFQAIGAGFLSGAGVAAAGTLVCAAAGPMKRETEEDVPAPEVGAKADLERGA